MRRYQAKDGSWRVWIEPDEVDTMMERVLREAGLYPTEARPVVDLEELLEGYLGALLDQHATLEPTELGVTEFAPGRPAVVRINRDLTGSALEREGRDLGTRGRWRATVAHEASHVILHKDLGADESQGRLFAPGPEDGCVRHYRCLKREVGFGAIEALRRSQESRWLEVQANLGMAALLMPRALFERLSLKEAGGSPLTEGSEAVGRLERFASETFGVSRQAARIRLATVGVVRSAAQPTLGGL